MTALADFYDALPTITDFAQAVKPENHSPVPDDWVVGFADVVGSTKAMADGRYKAVNMVGAGVIAAFANAIGRRPFPFVFGGDGASFVVPGEFGEAAAQALQAMAGYAEDEYQLQLRVATAPVATVRAAGSDIRVARYASSSDCAYAMFSGGGLTWFEKQAKGGAYLLPRSAPGVLPDLAGLSCRWGLEPAKHGVVLSLIVAPRGRDPRFAALLDDIVRFAATAENAGCPVTMDSLRPGPASQAISFEALNLHAAGALRWLARIQAAMLYGLGYVFYRFRPTIGGFSMNNFMREITTNTDFRKFDDGLRMTLDCTSEFADELERRLVAASDYAQYGVFRQSRALLTCFVLAADSLGHIHFVDGAGGGYTMAAKEMKARAAAFREPALAS